MNIVFAWSIAIHRYAQAVTLAVPKRRLISFCRSLTRIGFVRNNTTPTEDDVTAESMSSLSISGPILKGKFWSNRHRLDSVWLH